MAHRERRPPSPRASLRTASDDELVAGDSTRPLSSSPTAPDDAVAPGPNAETLALMVVPVAIGSYGTAVQLVGRLDYRGVMLLNCCTYIVATLGIQALRIWLGQQDGQPPRVPRRATWVLGGQLGCIVAVATALQTMGLQRTTASRAGFLVQLSSVFVPLGEAVIYRRPPPRRLLAAMAMSLIGTALLVFDTHAAFGALTSTPAPSGHTDKASAGAATSDSGDALVVLAAALYSAHILALGQSAAEHQPLELATSKSLIQLLASVAGWSAASIVGGDNSRVDAAGDTAGNGVAGFGNTLLTPRGGLLVLWTGLVTCAYPMWAQTFGQSKIRPVEASLIYGTAPLWSAVFALALLGQGFASAQSLAGAVLMLAGFLIAIGSGPGAPRDRPEDRRPPHLQKAKQVLYADNTPT